MEEKSTWLKQVKSTTSIEDAIHYKDTEAMNERHVKFAKKGHSEFSHWIQTEDDLKVKQNQDSFMKTQNTMMKDVPDGHVNEEKEKDQCAKFVKMKS